jgi:hypothetical protein
MGMLGDVDFQTPLYNDKPGTKKINLVIDTVFGEVEIE